MTNRSASVFGLVGDSGVVVVEDTDVQTVLALLAYSAPGGGSIVMSALKS